MPQCGFSHAAHDRAAETGSSMRCDNNKICTFLCRDLLNRIGTISGNNAGIDRNIVEIDVP